MTLADVLAILAGLSIVGVGFACLAAILGMLVPNALGRAEARAAERPWRSLVLGLLVFLGALVLFGGLVKSGGAARLAAAAVVLAGLSLAVLGGAAMASRLGRRSRRDETRPASPDDLLRGVLLLEGAALFPIVGWFVVLPAAFLVSLGAGFHAAIRRRAPGAAVTAPLPQA